MFGLASKHNDSYSGKVISLVDGLMQWRSQRGAEGAPAPPSGIRLCSTSSFY